MEIKFTNDWIQSSPHFCHAQWGEIWLQCEADGIDMWKSSVSLPSFISGISLFDSTAFSTQSIDSAQRNAEELAIKLLLGLRNWTNDILKQHMGM